MSYNFSTHVGAVLSQVITRKTKPFPHAVLVIRFDDGGYIDIFLPFDAHIPGVIEEINTNEPAA